MTPTLRLAPRPLALAGALVLAVSALFASTDTAHAQSGVLPTIVINEVESSGGVPGDWVELLNVGALPVDVGGLRFKDNDNTRTFAIVTNTTIPAGGFLVLDEASFGFGLGASDAARLFLADGTTVVDSYVWTAHAATTYGRCPDGTGVFVTTAASTKGAGNSCGSPSTTTTILPGGGEFLPWLGATVVQPGSTAGAFASNLSGLAYQPSGSTSPGVVWGVRNGPGTLYRLLFNGTNWIPDAANNWGSGKALLYPDGVTTNPDSEGVALAGGFGASAGSEGVYVATERSNSVGGTSRNSVLRFDPTSSAATLTATREWNLTAELPVVAPNAGMEAITWVPDNYLVGAGFRDQITNAPYSPATYQNHGSGLFFIGLETEGTIYAYALNSDGTFNRVATFSSGLSATADLFFDRELNQLWAVCDDTCVGRTVTMTVDASTGSFGPVRLNERPAAMANLNNEGFTIAALSECVNGERPALWADDGETDGISIRRGTVTCALSSVTVSSVAPLPVVVFGLALLGAAFVLLRRRRRTSFITQRSA